MKIMRYVGVISRAIPGIMLWSVLTVSAVLGGSCSASKAKTSDSLDVAANAEAADLPSFSADSAYRYVEAQVDFGPRVPNTDAHRKAGDWLAGELRRHGAEVIEQKMQLKAFDGTVLDSRNILGRYNPEAGERLLLLAHWDCRPWADEDPDEGKRRLPVDGANDGASGVGVLLEIARQLSIEAPKKGVDILFVDAEDWGAEGEDESWALGAKYFAEHPPVKGYSATEGILLDMVGGENARFHREYFSERSAAGLNASIWSLADELGYGDRFVNQMGGAITDDHIEMIEAGIPTIDIIEYNRSGGGFNPRWHTTSDTMEGISKGTLGVVGETVMGYLRKKY